MRESWLRREWKDWKETSWTARIICGWMILCMLAAVIFVIPDSRKLQKPPDPIVMKLEALEERIISLQAEIIKLQSAVSRVEEKWAFASPIETTASWYALGLKNPDGYGCASNVYPRGSRLKVVDPVTGRIIEVQVLDFGPDPRIHPDRHLDLWRGPAEEMGMIQCGLKPVIQWRIK